jgi:hypothetical protein
MGDWFLHPRRRHLADAIVLAWVLAWAVLGWTAGRALDKVSEVTRSAEGAGTAVVRTGESIRDVDAPVIGPVFKETGESVIDAGKAARDQARDSGSSVRKAAILLGLAVWLVPSLPLLFSYGPARVVRGRELRSLRAMLAGHAGDPDLERMLAARALVHLPYRRLRAMGEPWAAFGAGDYRALADAELAREGMTRR